VNEFSEPGSSCDYSIVIPVHNEQECLRELYARLTAVLDELSGEAELIFVDDGSTDLSPEILSELLARDQRVRVIQLSRNFGHQIAITAGLDSASGQAIVIMDADLQDPPEVIPELVSRWREGFDIVSAVREERLGETRFKRLTASLFYRLFRRLADVEITTNAGDFRLVDRKALDAFKELRENNRYVRGMFGWIGFTQTEVRYVRSERFAGRTKYPLHKMLKFAVDGIVSFSNVPLRVALNLGFVVSVMAFLLGVAAVIAKVAGAFVVPGWASLLVATSFLGGIQLIVIGVMGEYIARIHEEVKHRPLYIVRGVSGFPGGATPEPRAIVTSIRSGSDLHEQPS
jgi:glycosyltransferase involved in cell wall biosynthesis